MSNYPKGWDFGDTEVHSSLKAQLSSHFIILFSVVIFLLIFRLRLVVKQSCISKAVQFLYQIDPRPCPDMQSTGYLHQRPLMILSFALENAMQKS